MRHGRSRELMRGLGGCSHMLRQFQGGDESLQLVSERHDGPFCERLWRGSLARRSGFATHSLRDLGQVT